MKVKISSDKRFHVAVSAGSELQLVSELEVSTPYWQLGRVRSKQDVARSCSKWFVCGIHFRCAGRCTAVRSLMRARESDYCKGVDYNMRVDENANLAYTAGRRHRS